MQILKLLFGIGAVLGMVACSRTPLPTFRDAAAVQQVPDAGANPDLAITPAPDLAAPDVLAPDAAVPDSAAGADLLARDTIGPDATASDLLARDAGSDVADVLARDAGSDVADVLAGDATTADVVTMEASSDLRDSAGPEAVNVTDTGDAVGDPFAGRSFRIDDMNPAPTPDPTCTPTEPACSAYLTFSSDLTTLTGVATRGSAALKFTATAGPESNKLTYHVTSLSGGLVFFERDQGVYVAQIVLYGSGVPVTWCLRGTMKPQP